MKFLALLPLVLLIGCGGGGGKTPDDGKVRLVNAHPAADPVEVFVNGVEREPLDYGDGVDLLNGGGNFDLDLQEGGDSWHKNVPLETERIQWLVLTRDGFRTVHDNAYEGTGDDRIRVLVDESDHNLDVVLTDGSEFAEDAMERWTDVSYKGDATSHRIGEGTHRLLAVEPGTDTVVAASSTFSNPNGDLFVMVREDGEKWIRRFRR